MIDARKLAIPILAIVASAITACGGGGGGSAVPTAPKVAGGKGSLALVLSMPAAPAHASAALRKRFAVSSSTQGLVIQAYVSPYSATATPVTVGYFDVSPASASCTTNATDNSRTCSLNLSLNSGTYDLQVASYDQAPAGTTLPATAHQLGYGFLSSQIVTAGASNSVALTVAGIVASVKVTLPVTAVSALDASSQYASVAVLDAAGSVILGSYIDGAGNAVTATMSDTTSSGLVSFNPSSFASSLSTGVQVSYSPSSITAAEMTGGAFPTITATLNTSARQTSSTTLSVPAPETMLTPAAFSGGTPYGISSDSSGNIWVALRGTNAIGEVAPTTLNATVPYTSIYTPAPTSVTPGPDGNMWFTEPGQGSNSNLIGKITSGGAETDYATASFASQPFDITSDGTNMWYTEASIDKVGEMTTSGTALTEVAVAAGAGLYGIAYDGGSGRIWFTESGLANVGAISASSATLLTEQLVPAGAIPTRMCGPANGLMFFGAANAGDYGTVSPTQAPTIYPIAGVATTLACTLGPDGNVWFVGTSSTAQLLIRVIPTTLHADVFPLNASKVYAITTGRDGNLWISDRTGNGVLRVRP